MSNDIQTQLSKLSNEIPEGSVWSYCGGGNYKIISLELNATSYEETHEAGIIVRYEQLSAGSFPKGQIWVRTVEDFKSSVDDNGVMVAKFSMI